MVLRVPRGAHKGSFERCGCVRGRVPPKDTKMRPTFHQRHKRGSPLTLARQDLKAARLNAWGPERNPAPSRPPPDSFVSPRWAGVGLAFLWGVWLGSLISVRSIWLRCRFHQQDSGFTRGFLETQEVKMDFGRQAMGTNLCAKRCWRTPANPGFDEPTGYNSIHEECMSCYKFILGALVPYCALGTRMIFSHAGKEGCRG